MTGKDAAAPRKGYIHNRLLAAAISFFIPGLGLVLYKPTKGSVFCAIIFLLFMAIASCMVLFVFLLGTFSGSVLAVASGGMLFFMPLLFLPALAFLPLFQLFFAVHTYVFTGHSPREIQTKFMKMIAGLGLPGVTMRNLEKLRIIDWPD